MKAISGQWLSGGGVSVHGAGVAPGTWGSVGELVTFMLKPAVGPDDEQGWLPSPRTTGERPRWLAGSSPDPSPLRSVCLEEKPWKFIPGLAELSTVQCQLRAAGQLSVLKTPCPSPEPGSGGLACSVNGLLLVTLPSNKQRLRMLTRVTVPMPYKRLDAVLPPNH